ncbi:MAG: AraC family transcriptional regulator [Flammeovirgaceae bacterium]|nr:AraC family transcriptional regulator [Flammeovirgaceae bacterium]MBE61410.1 AraC family transcriptional regulator [Flammeovirgaceae bacterium]HCX20459.1 AraC family transcriptional regulator [Cytophagales bacterium]|tara:strand:- start:78 stop:644 length:567 start_codon:yes stop_codon:yes gene_type:complete
MAETIYVKNMVCPRCIAAVTKSFEDAGVAPDTVSLGEVKISTPLTDQHIHHIESNLSQQGFELLNPGKSAIITQIKAAIVEQVHYQKEPLKVNFSTYLSEKLHQDYSSLSRLFSSVEGVTIEKFIMSQKIEKVKELLRYDQLTLSQIALQLDYSSVAHLSTQFKKETGMTPSEFKKQKDNHRKNIDEI